MGSDSRKMFTELKGIRKHKKENAMAFAVLFARGVRLMLEENPEITARVYREYWDLHVDEGRGPDAFCSFLVYDPGMDVWSGGLELVGFDETVQDMARAMVFDDDRFVQLVQSNTTRPFLMRAALYFMVVLRDLRFTAKDLVAHIRIQDTPEDNRLAVLSANLIKGCTAETVMSAFASI